MGLSSFASKPVEEVVAANPKTFLQLYWVGSRKEMKPRIEPARAAGAVGVIATTDWTFANGRDWGSPTVPERINLKTALAFAPAVLRHPRWLLKYLRSGHLPDLSVPNMAEPGQRPPTFFGAYGQWMQSPTPTWEDISWLRDEWGGPFMLKGQAGACPDQTRAVPCKVRAVTAKTSMIRNMRGMVSATGEMTDRVQAGRIHKFASALATNVHRLG